MLAVWGRRNEVFAGTVAGQLLRRDGGGWQREPLEAAHPIQAIGGTAERTVVTSDDVVYERRATGWAATEGVGEQLAAVIGDGDAIAVVDVTGVVYRSPSRAGSQGTRTGPKAIA